VSNTAGCCASAHSAVDAVLELKTQHAFSPAEVRAVQVGTAESVVVQCGFEYRAAGVVQAQMSLQYIVAVALLESGALLAQFSEDKIAEPQVLDLARRVTIVRDPEIDRLYPARYANRAVITLKDGRRLEARVDHPRGSSGRPLSLAEVAEKFGSLTAGVLSPLQAERILATVERLEHLGNIREPTRLMSHP
jgi:2-methylcitrate dehydratase PrpD